MKSKILCALLAVCMLVCLLPLSVSAADPDITVYFSNTTKEARLTLTIAPGETKYVVTNSEKQFALWTESTAPTDKFVKLEYPADGNATLQATLNNIDSDNTSTGIYNNHNIWFGAGEYGIVINLVGDNKIASKSSSCIYHDAKNGMTITGAGKLSTLSTGGVSGSIWTRGGDLLIKNTVLDLTCSQLEGNSVYNAILSTYGNVNIEGSKITYSTDGGRLVFMGSPAYMGTENEGFARYTLDTATDRFITIKDSEISGSASTGTFSSPTPCVVINSTLKLKKLGSSNDAEKAIFNIAPKLEGEYTAIAGLVKNADKPENLKVFDAKKLTSYTYFYMVPGIQELIPTKPEPEVTVPDTTDPDPIVPDTTTPDASTPDASTPDASTPDASTPSASTPDASTPSASTPSTTQPSGDTNTNTNTNTGTDKTDDTNKADTADKKDDGKKDDSEKNPMKVILIVLAALLVVACGAFGVIFYLKKKKA